MAFLIKVYDSDSNLNSSEEFWGITINIFVVLLLKLTSCKGRFIFLSSSWFLNGRLDMTVYKLKGQMVRDGNMSSN